MPVFVKRDDRDCDEQDDRNQAKEKGDQAHHVFANDDVGLRLCGLFAGPNLVDLFFEFLREIVNEFACLSLNALMVFRVGRVNRHSSSPGGRLRV